MSAHKDDSETFPEDDQFACLVIIISHADQLEPMIGGGQHLDQSDLWYGTPEFRSDHKYVTLKLPDIVTAWTKDKEDRQVRLKDNENEFTKAVHYFNNSRGSGGKKRPKLEIAVKCSCNPPNQAHFPADFECGT